MMNSPFYGNRSLPAKKKKVVSVPVHFISSDQPPTLMSRESAAVKIQKVLRGFLVRKSVNKICSVRKEIVNIEQRITKEEEEEEEEFINTIREDPKETQLDKIMSPLPKRKSVNKIMSLLLKLDSIRGFDSGVRDFRKSVTKMAIALQDKVDSIAQPQPQPQPQPPHHDSSNTNKQNVKEEEIVVDDAKEECVGCSMEVQKHNDDEEEKVICENDKMKQMMERMSERNEMHTRMINSLTRRLDHLENAFLLTNQKKKTKSTSNAFRRRRRRERMDYTW